jgi:DNA repair exonuclease SbcCD nuclease subunit
MKIAIITDTHFGVRNDNQEFLDYFMRFYDHVFFPKLREFGITTILHLGDVVDRRKFISYVTLRRMREGFIDKLDDYNVHVLVGNHDIPYKNTNDINAMRELFAGKPNIKLYMDPEEVSIDGCNILFLPWINQENYQQSIELINSTKAQIAMGHLEVKGFDMYRGMPSHEGFEPITFDKFDMVFSGHYHHMSRKGNIHYLGAPYEMIWSDWGDAHGFHIFDTDTRDLEFIKNPYQMFQKVWYNDENTTIEKLLNPFPNVKNMQVKVIVQSKTNPYWFDLFMGKIYEDGALDATIVEDHRNMDAISDSDLVSEAEDTLTILSKYIQGLEIGVDKGDLEKLMHGLYNEALSMESAT